MPMTIPDEDRRALQLLARLDAAAQDVLVTALESAPVGFHEDELVDWATHKADVVAVDHTRPIVGVIAQVAVMKAFIDMPTRRFVDDVVESMVDGTQDIQLSADEGASLGQALTKFLEIPAIARPAKAKALALEHENSFCRAKIFTDIRPVFGGDALTQPDTAVIVNCLKLTYHHGSGLKDLFVTLTREDLDALGEVLDRAKTKTETLHRLLDRVDIHPISE